MLRFIISFLILTISLGGAALSAGEHGHGSTEPASHSHGALESDCASPEGAKAVTQCCLEDHSDCDGGHTHLLQLPLSSRTTSPRSSQHPQLCSSLPRGMVGWGPETRQAPLFRRATGPTGFQRQLSLESIVLLI